jgi:hypothetical protein
MPNVNVAALSAEMNQNVEQINTLFNLKMRTMGDVLRDFQVRGINQKLRMFRKTIGNVTQPSFKNDNENFSADLLTVQQRDLTLQAGKVDVKFGEAEIEALTHGLFNELEPATPADIHSLAGQEMILEALFAQMEAEIAVAPYKGVRGVTQVLNGGLNLFDGLAVQFTAAIAATEMTAVANSLNPVSGAVTFTDVNILAELKKYRDKLLANQALARSIRQEGYNIHINPALMVLAADAQDNAISNKDQVITRDAAGNWVFKSLQKAKFVESNWMDAESTNFFGTLPGNLYYGYGTNNLKGKLEFEKRGRSLVILGDFNAAVGFADPRSIMLYKGYSI